MNDWSTSSEESKTGTFESIDRIIAPYDPKKDAHVTCKKCGRPVHKYKNWTKVTKGADFPGGVSSSTRIDETWRGKCPYGHRVGYSHTIYGWNRQ